MRDLRSSVGPEAALKLGSDVRSIRELAVQLEGMPDAAFRKQRTAIAKWVKEHFDAKLSTALRSSKTAAAAVKAIAEHLKKSKHRVQTAVQQAPRVAGAVKKVEHESKPKRISLPRRIIRKAPIPQRKRIKSFIARLIP